MDAVGPRLREEELTLRRRIGHLCNPKGLSGHFILAFRRRRLVRKLRKRFEHPYSMFLTQSIDSGRPTEGRRTADQASPERAWPAARFR
jgi:hypothetical protein